MLVMKLISLYICLAVTWQMGWEGFGCGGGGYARLPQWWPN